MLIQVSTLVDRLFDNLLLLVDVLLFEGFHVLLELLLGELVSLVYLMDSLFELCQEFLEFRLVK